MSDLVDARTKIEREDHAMLTALSLASCDDIATIMRDLRNPKFGGYEVERRYVRRGLHEYRLVVGQLRLVA